MYGGRVLDASFEDDLGVVEEGHFTGLGELVGQ
jgi:hypothetical protein